MSSSDYSQEELERYFSDPSARRTPNSDDGSRVAAQLTVVLGVALFLLAGTLGLIGYMWTLTDELPSMRQLEQPRLELATVVYTADGEEMARFHRQNRIWAPYSEISPPVINALVATEDHRFYEHWGIDVFRTLSVPYHLLLGERQGGSTITQQLARNLYRQKIGYDVSIKRKLKEMITAVYIERNYTKREILEMYLNTVPFGNNSYGIESAAYTYFGKSADELSVLESSLLVGILRATSYYNPVRHPERAEMRRNIVLAQMEKRGHISPAQYDTLHTKGLQLDFHQASSNARFAPYFAEQVRLRLNEWAEESGHNIYTEGLEVHTTLNSHLQQIADSAVTRYGNALQDVVDVQWGRASPTLVSTDVHAYEKYRKTHDIEPFSYYWQRYPERLNEFVRETSRYKQLVGNGVGEAEALFQLKNNESFLDSLRQDKTRLQAGFVAINPANGYVRAWVGGREFQQEKYDHVSLARRQPGSTFKPFVYTAAIDNGYSPYFQLRDDTTTIYNPYNDKKWQPQNFTGESTGAMMTLRQGLIQSKNTITSRLVKMIGAERVASYAHRMGITTPLSEVPSIALGTTEVTLLEIVSAYGTLANGGLHSKPIMITRIEDRHGNVLARFAPERQEALSESTAYTMINMMRGTVEPGGTGVRIRHMFGIDHDVAGKTGTTQNSADGWFILIHPQLVGGAWVGFNDQRVTFRTTYWGQGAHNALYIVGRFFRDAIDHPNVGIQNISFVPPENYVPPRPIHQDTTSDSTGTAPALPTESDRTDW